MVQTFSVESRGGYLYAPELSDILRNHVQPSVRFRQFCTTYDHLGLGRGEVAQWDIVGDIPVDPDGVELREDEPIGKSSFTVSQDEVKITEYGTSVDYTFKLDALAKHAILPIVQNALANHARKSIDQAVYNEMEKTRWTVWGHNRGSGDNASTHITFSEDGDTKPTGTNQIAADDTAAELSKYHVRMISTEMEDRDIPTYKDGCYFALFRPKALINLKDDLEAVNQYVTPGWETYTKGEVGKFEGIRFITQTNIASASTGGRTDNGFFFGDDICVEAVALPEQIRFMPGQDFGRYNAVAWYGLFGYKLTRNDANNVHDNRVLMWRTFS